MKTDYAFAANAIGVFLLILKDHYSDKEIKCMFNQRKIGEMLKVLESHK